MRTGRLPAILPGMRTVYYIRSATFSTAMQRRWLRPGSQASRSLSLVLRNDDEVRKLSVNQNDCLKLCDEWLTQGQWWLNPFKITGN